MTAQDEWVFADMDLLHKVVAPAIRMSLKLHQVTIRFCKKEYAPKTLRKKISFQKWGRLSRQDVHERAGYLGSHVLRPCGYSRHGQWHSAPQSF